MKNLDLLPEVALFKMYEDRVMELARRRFMGAYEGDDLRDEMKLCRKELLRRLCAPEVFQLRMQSK